jgi:hypothetical protein
MSHSFKHPLLITSHLFSSLLRAMEPRTGYSYYYQPPLCSMNFTAVGGKAVEVCGDLWFEGKDIWVGDIPIGQSPNLQRIRMYDACMIAIGNAEHSRKQELLSAAAVDAAAMDAQMHEDKLAASTVDDDIVPVTPPPSQSAVARSASMPPPPRERRGKKASSRRARWAYLQRRQLTFYAPLPGKQNGAKLARNAVSSVYHA